MRVERNNGERAILAGVMAIALGIVCTSSVQQLELTAMGRPTGSPQLVSIEQLPDAEICLPDLMAALHEEPSLIAGLQQKEQRFAGSVPEGARTTADLTRPVVRTLRDLDPGYSSIAVDVRTDEVVLQDNNLWSTRIFNRLDNTAPTGKPTEPKRVIQGE